jgi:GDP-L-fucose synthase
MIPESILRSFAGAKIDITGGTGMIGREVTALLAPTGAQIKVISLDQIELQSGVELVRGDLCDFAFCREALRGANCVFHIAGVKAGVDTSKKRPASHFVPTLLMNTNLLEAARLNSVQKLVYTSSIGAYASAEIFRESENRNQPPMDFAGWAKRMGELQIEAYRKEYGIETYAVVRLANVYGPGDNFEPENAMVIPSLMARIAAGENPLVVWGDGSVIRDIAFSRDVAAGIILALYHGTDSSFINLGAGEGYSIRQILETLKSFIPFEYQFDPSKPSGYPRRVMDISLARKKLGYAPQTSLRDGLMETWSWYLSHRDESMKRFNYFR